MERSGMTNSLDSIVGLVWSETWHGFELSVLKTPEGFRSLTMAPWDDDAKMCNSPRQSQDKAIRRCWGMVRQDCELRAAQAAVKMCKPNVRLESRWAEQGEP